MRFSLNILILICLFSCAIDKPKKVSEVDLKVNILRSFDTLIIYRDTTFHKAFEIEFSIINMTSSAVSFWLMTCSWNENFILNNDYIHFLGWNCDANYPTIKSLNPYEQLTLRAKVLKYEFTRFQKIETTKFGMIFIDASKYRYINDYENIIGDKSRHEKIIWIDGKDQLGFVIIFENQYVLGENRNLIELTLKIKKKEVQMIWSKNSIYDAIYRPIFWNN